MPLIKGKDIQGRRGPAGCIAKWYPIQPENDLLGYTQGNRYGI